VIDLVRAEEVAHLLRVFARTLDSSVRVSVNLPAARCQATGQRFNQRMPLWIPPHAKKQPADDGQPYSVGLSVLLEPMTLSHDEFDNVRRCAPCFQNRRLEMPLLEFATHNQVRLRRTRRGPYHAL